MTGPDTTVVVPPLLKTVWLELVAEKGWAYLRYRHLRRALELAGPCETVLLLGAGRGFAGIALAMEFPETKFTISELPARRSRLGPATAFAKAHEMTNVTFASVDPTIPPLDFAAHDFVASAELLQQYPDTTEIADAVMRLSRRFVYALVPYADARTRHSLLAKERARERHGNRVVGFDAFDLLALFPNPLAVRGCYWQNGGAMMRAALEQLEVPEGQAIVSVVEENFAELVSLGESDLRRGWPRSAKEAGGIWVLARAGVAAAAADDPSPGWLARIFATPKAPAPILRQPKVFEARELLEISGMFDADFYRARYPELAEASVDPLDHYVGRGVREGYWPNASFDASAYVRAAQIDRHTVNPVVHFLSHPAVPYTRQGVVETRARVAPASRSAASTEPAHGVPCLPYVDLTRLAVTILMPIHDGGDHVRRAIEAVRSEARLHDVALLLVDDASTDAALVRDLAAYAKLPGITVLRNDENLGFTRSVNRGLAHVAEHARERDVVLLNSDTRVGPRFLEALALAAYRAPNTATATALSDNAGAFSTPAKGVNTAPDSMPLEQITRLSRRAAALEAVYVPTGNGFCMYMRADALRDTGPLDATHFPRGYGEENDWCMRARERSWTHAIALRAYVHHVNSVSFGDEKAKLIPNARVVLDRLHPDFTAAIRAEFDGAEGLAAQRAALGAALDARRDSPLPPPRPRIAFVVSTKTGGVPLSNEDLMRGLAHLYEPLVIACDSKTLTLLDATSSPHTPLAHHELATPIAMLPHTSDEYDAVLATWLEAHAIELMHVQHVGWHGLGLTRVARRLGIPVVVALHDFYAICPSVNLTDGRGPWAPMGFANKVLVAPLWERRHPESYERAKAMAPRAFHTLWQRRMSAMLEAADRFVTPSSSAKDILTSALPLLAERSAHVHVIAHGRDFDDFGDATAAPSPTARLRILAPGNLGATKGLGTLLELADLDTEGVLDLHTLGEVPKSIADDARFTNHGPYERDDFVTRARGIAPHVALLPSVWPETFSYTLTESWAAGLPVIGSELGAIGDRLADTGAGWPVDPTDARAILALARRIRDDASLWQSAMDRVRAWQEGPGRTETVRAMASEYLDVYRDLLASRRRFGSRAERRAAGLRTRIALVASGAFPDSPPSVHVRIASALPHADGTSEYVWVDAETLIRSSILDFDAVIVCRNALGASLLDELVDTCARTRTPWVVDLDDDLLHVPEENDVSGAYAKAAPALRRLIAGAHHVFVSTDALAEKMKPIAKAVSVAPNALSRSQWLEPIAPTAAAVHEPRKPLRVLYFGSRTHKADLDLVHPAITRLHAESGLTLVVVGIDREEREGVVRVDPPEARYDRFVPWLRELATTCDIAVAPLVDTEFNRGKSNLKLLEYAALGLPVVASRVSPYSDTIAHDVDGWLVPNEPDAWADALARLGADPDLRRRLADAANARVAREFVHSRCHLDAIVWPRE